jgi:hypothetical protein
LQKTLSGFNFLVDQFFGDQVVMAFNAGHTDFQRLHGLALATLALRLYRALLVAFPAGDAIVVAKPVPRGVSQPVSLSYPGLRASSSGQVSGFVIEANFTQQITGTIDHARVCPIWTDI